MGQFAHYVGVGANYTWFFWTKSWMTNNLLANLYGGFPVGDGVNVHGTASIALDVGFDYYLTQHWVINADAKYLPMETDASVLGVQNAGHINVNPWLVRLAVGYRFGLADPGLGAPVVAKY